MPTVIEPDIEWLEFDAVTSPSLPMVPSATPGWKALDYTQLYLPAPKLGANRHVPGVDGRLQITRERDEHTFILPWRIKGKKNWEGEVYSDSFEGVATNHQYLIDNVFDIEWHRPVTFNQRDGQTRTGLLVVEDWTCSPDPNSAGDVLVGQLRLVGSLSGPTGS